MERRYKYRRKLPHIQKDDPLFVTFHTKNWWPLPEVVRHHVMDACRKGDGWKFELHAVVVMPEHVHLLITPLSDDKGPYEIGEIIRGIKRGSAAAINSGRRITLGWGVNLRSNELQPDTPAYRACH